MPKDGCSPTSGGTVSAAAAGGTFSAAAAGGYTPGQASGSGGDTAMPKGIVIKNEYDGDYPLRALERKWMKELLHYKEWEAKGWREPLVWKQEKDYTEEDRLKAKWLHSGKRIRTLTCVKCNAQNPEGTVFCYQCREVVNEDLINPIEATRLRKQRVAASPWGKFKRRPRKAFEIARTEFAAERRAANKYEKRAKKLGYKSAAWRVILDPKFSFQMSTRPLGTVGGDSSVAILAGASALLTQFLPVANAAKAEGDLTVLGHVFVEDNVLYVTTGMVLAILFLLVFVCGLSARSIATFMKRWVLGGLRVACKGAQVRRDVGVQSQCTYLRDQAVPRFQAYENGFRRAGEVTAGLPYLV